MGMVTDPLAVLNAVSLKEAALTDYDGPADDGFDSEAAIRRMRWRAGGRGGVAAVVCDASLALGSLALHPLRRMTEGDSQ